MCRSSNFLKSKTLRSNHCKLKYIKCFKEIKSVKIKNLETRGVFLNLFHAHGVSPKKLCFCRLNPFAIRTRSATSVHKFAEPPNSVLHRTHLTIIKDITSMSFIMVETRGVEPLSKMDKDKPLRV